MIVIALRPEFSPSALAHARLTPMVEAAIAPDGWWLRVPAGEADAAMLRRLPARRVFQFHPDQTLTPLGKKLPTEALPDGLDWRPLTERLAPILGRRSLPGQLGEDLAPLLLVRGGEPVEPNLLLGSIGEFHAFAENAPSVRLRRLAFAMAAGGRVAVLGYPPPPIPGQRAHLADGVALPLGWRFDPPISLAGVRALLGLSAPEIALFAPDSTWERLQQEDFVRAHRAAIRLSHERFAAGLTRS